MLLGFSNPLACPRELLKCALINWRCAVVGPEHTKAVKSMTDWHDCSSLTTPDRRQSSPYCSLSYPRYTASGGLTYQESTIGSFRLFILPPAHRSTSILPQLPMTTSQWETGSTWCPYTRSRPKSKYSLQLHPDVVSVSKNATFVGLNFRTMSTLHKQQKTIQRKRSQDDMMGARMPT
jgi:hypothetical protein